MTRRESLMLMVTVLGLSAGCDQNEYQADHGKGDGPAKENKTPVLGESPFVLNAEPAGVTGVIELRKQAKKDDEVVVVGRVGGSVKPFVEGRAGFLMVDTSLTPTDGCDTPWDFCELTKEEVAAARVSVKFVGPDGKTHPVGAKELFGIKELSTVVVKGKVTRDDKDNVGVLATGIFVRKGQQ